jgi:hypothetical protein
MSELLMKYFKGTKRTKGEGMSDYATRKAEAYTRAQQSMARYLQEQKSGASWSNRPQSSWNTGHSQNMGSSVMADQKIYKTQPAMMKIAGRLIAKWAQPRLGLKKHRAKNKEVPVGIRSLNCPGGVSRDGMITLTVVLGETMVAGIAAKLPTTQPCGDGVSCQRLSQPSCKDGISS